MKIVAGFFSLTQVTVATEHRTYNQWHMLDHLPEQLTLPGIGWGQRWVSTPACKCARSVSTAQFDDVHYLTLYLLGPPLERSLADFARLARELADRGRFHRHRRTALTGTFEVVHCSAAPRVHVSGSAVPYRPNLGIHLRLDEVVDLDRIDLYDQWLARDHLPALVASEGVTGAWTFRRPPAPGRSASGAAGQRITVAWLDAPPLEVTAAIASLPQPPPSLVRPVLEGPFESIEPHRWDWFDESVRDGGNQ